MDDHGGRVHYLKGSPYAIGLALGRRLGPKVEQHIARYIGEFCEASAKFVIDLDRLQTEALPWLGRLPARFQEEFAGIAEGAGVSLARVAQWFFIEQCATPRCSAAVCVLDGHAWVARNNDTVAPGMWGYAGIREVDGRIPAISFGREGDVFTPTGINRERLWLHYHFLPVADAPAADQPHLPPYVVMTEALETCRSIADVETLLSAGQRSDGMLLFVVDGKTDEFAIMECGCTAHYKREPVAGRLVGTNHYCTCEDPGGPLAERPFSTLSRFRRVTTLVDALYDRPGERRMPKDLIRVLADDAVERRDATFATAYANVACPHTGELWYTFGGVPAASQGNWQRLAWPWPD